MVGLSYTRMCCMVVRCAIETHGLVNVGVYRYNIEYGDPDAVLVAAPADAVISTPRSATEVPAAVVEAAQVRTQGVAPVMVCFVWEVTTCTPVFSLVGGCMCVCAHDDARRPPTLPSLWTRLT